MFNFKFSYNHPSNDKKWSITDIEHSVILHLKDQ